MGFMREPALMVGVMMFREDGKVLVHESDNWSGKYTFPGSRVLYGETLEESVIRTAQKKTGMDISDPRLLLVMEMINDLESTAKESGAMWSPKWGSATAAWRQPKTTASCRTSG